MSASQPSHISDALLALWEQFRVTIMGRVETIEQASAAWSRGSLDAELRRKAEQEAHKLAGVLGSFGLSEGSRIAGAVEQLLQPEATLDCQDAARLSEYASELRRLAERGPEARSSAAHAP